MKFLNKPEYVKERTKQRVATSSSLHTSLAQFQVKVDPRIIALDCSVVVVFFGVAVNLSTLPVRLNKGFLLGRLLDVLVSVTGKETSAHSWQVTQCVQSPAHCRSFNLEHRTLDHQHDERITSPLLT